MLIGCYSSGEIQLDGNEFMEAHTLLDETFFTQSLMTEELRFLVDDAGKVLLFINHFASS